MDAPIYKVVIDYDNESGMYTNSFVDEPAVEVNAIAFSKQNKQLQFKSISEQKFMSVSILANTPIPRLTESGEKYYVIFEAPDIKMIVNKMVMDGHAHKVNYNHNPDEKIEGIYLVESFFVEKGRVECPIFKDVPDGSYIQTYWVKDSEQYNQLLNDENFNGFSVEINAMLEEAFIKHNPQLSEIFNAIDVIFDSITDNNQRAKAVQKYLEKMNVI